MPRTWDIKEQNYLLSEIGLAKPLYYTQDEKVFRFRVKSDNSFIDKQNFQKSVKPVFCLTYSAPHTIYENVFKLEPDIFRDLLQVFRKRFYNLLEQFEEADTKIQSYEVPKNN